MFAPASAVRAFSSRTCAFSSRTCVARVLRYEHTPHNPPPPHPPPLNPHPLNPTENPLLRPHSSQSPHVPHPLSIPHPACVRCCRYLLHLSSCLHPPPILRSIPCCAKVLFSVTDVVFVLCAGWLGIKHLGSCRSRRLLSIDTCRAFHTCVSPSLLYVMCGALFPT